MTADTRTITISIPPALQARMRSRIAQKQVTRSEYVRDLIVRDLEGDGTAHAGAGVGSNAVEGRLGFIELGIDALLKHHPNSELRDVVHNTHRERVQRRPGTEVEA